MTNQDSDMQQTLDEGRRMWGLVREYAKLEVVDKLSFVLSLLIVGGVLMCLFAIALYCLCMFIVARLTVSTGSEALSFLIVGFALMAVAGIFVYLRKSFVTRPVIRALMKEFFKKPAQPLGKEENDEED